MTTLCTLARKHKTDKALWYAPFYDILFESKRFKYHRILEIGIGSKQSMAHVKGYEPGASLRMWSDFFPAAEIIGVDIEPFEDMAVRTVCSDSTNPELPEKLGGSFDLIVDDGSHDQNIQYQTFLNLYPMVRDGGFYIIEDAKDWRKLCELVGMHNSFPQVMISPHGGFEGKLVLVRK